MRAISMELCEVELFTDKACTRPAPPVKRVFASSGESRGWRAADGRTDLSTACKRDSMWSSNSPMIYDAAPPPPPFMLHGLHLGDGARLPPTPYPTPVPPPTSRETARRI